MREAASFIASQSLSPTGLLATAVQGVLAPIRWWKSRRQLMRLVDTDDHLLMDIGVSRDDVRWALDLPFSHDPGRELQVRALRNRARERRR